MQIPKEVKNIIKKLEKAGFEAYIVGGCVRDFLLGKEPKDWDITTNAKPEEIIKIFPEGRYENKFGTVVIGEVEVTTYRIEAKYTDKRHPDEVRFAAKLEDDLARRDFTVNAMAMRLESGIRNQESGRNRNTNSSNIIDPFRGQDDLKDKIIRAVGDPEERFSEDALRLLRAVRFAAELHFEIEEKTKEAIKKLEKLGAKMSEVSLPLVSYALATYYIIVPSEISSNLARYDGIKYGHSEIRNPKSKIRNLLDVYLKSRSEGFGDEAKRRIMLGTYALSAGYYEAYYLKAKKVQAKIKEDFDKVFEKVDCLITPTSPTPAFKIGEKIEDPLTMYLSDVFTVPINIAGLPAISIPCGFAQNLPVGLQIIGKQFDEEKIFNIAQIYQENTNWHKEKPNLK